jgi:hypothetical protein
VVVLFGLIQMLGVQKYWREIGKGKKKACIYFHSLIFIYLSYFILLFILFYYLFYFIIYFI